jgi:triacylglycerol lipase
VFWIATVVALALLLPLLHPRVRAWIAAKRAELLRAYRKRRGAARPRYPIVLVHGIMGFDTLTFAGPTADYFRGVVAELAKLGVRVFVARLPPLGGIEQRARILADYVRTIDADRVNLVAHSMGGLDARYAIAKLGLEKKVASLVTIGTPHRGTPIADRGSRVLSTLGLGKLARTLGFDLAAFEDLTIPSMERFNREIPDAAGVFYASVLAIGGRAGAGDQVRVHPLLRPTHRLLAPGGPNDGLVPSESQRWGVVVAEVPSDHWGVIGWSGAFDVPDLYRRIARELGERGF